MPVFPQFQDFIDFVEKNAHPISLKVFGKQDKFTWSLFKYFYDDLGDPLETTDADFPIETSFGKIFKKKCMVEEQKCYSKSVISAADGSNHFQGDIIPLPLKNPFGESKYCMILSHSCEIGTATDEGRAPLVLMVPLFEEKDFDQKTVEALAGKTYKSHQGAMSGLGSWFENKSHKFIAMPPHTNNQMNIDRFIIPLWLALPVPREQVLKVEPKLRLTFRGLAFLQLKLISCHFRDPERSDETRDY